MKKKTLLIIACIVSLVMGFTGCSESTFAVVINDDLNVEITAENADEEMVGTVSTFTVSEGDGVLIEPNFEEGTVLVEFYPFDASEDMDADEEELMPTGKPEFEVEVTGTDPIECQFAAGDYMVNAEVLEKASGTAVISLIPAEENDPWTKVSSAAEAAKGAGNMEDFEVPEFPRRDTSLEKLAKLKATFKEDGKVTAGNSSGMNDAASGVILMDEDKAKELGVPILARVLSVGAVGLDPDYMGLGPIGASQKVLKKAGLTVDDIDLWEMNEAFAAQCLACQRELGIDIDKLNVNGGGISIGHPVGATGARLVVTLVHELARREQKYGVATLCAGGGMGVAVLVEMV